MTATNGPMNFTSRWVLVTGASSGLGREIACQLAREHHANLILVARRAAHLNALKERLEAGYGVKCEVIAADLSDPAEVERVYAVATAIGDIYGVVLNAGVTYFGRHTDMAWADFQNMLAINVSSVVRLTSLFAPDMIRRENGGGLLLISSMAGLLPVPYQAAYAGTKAFITNFAQSLHQELHDAKVSVTLFSPGGIDTEMTQNSNLKYFENTLFLQDVNSCASEAIHALRTRRAHYVPGMLNRTQLALSRLVPRNVVGLLARNVYRKALDGIQELP